ncbi:Cobalamin (vitamin B12) biosynthesis CobW-like, C-terminal [Penicillium italicum]|uniref:Cobalamin (Vitamin B12) biosynthesis CobW-like, C-terminal n=1 Tax=Penicillium italicum TaxID=40296 RepID=A0A0A2L748_PENIT|nr:Cobalamin (vitamin B12) biosynthesis CobW-like, C-terminal [Penicillium italicum]
MVIDSGKDTASYKVPATEEDKPTRQIPVTLLSGFLGSGKTTLLKHILGSPDHGLRIAVIVNDMSQLNIDATLIQNHKVSQTTEKLIKLQNGCICCTLRGDLLAELASLTKQNEIDYVVIESTGISEPMQVAETFTAEFSSAMLEAEDQISSDDVDAKKILDEIVELGGLHTMARLDTTVTVIDAFNLLSSFDTAEFLSDRYGKDEIIPEDERTISDLMVDQIEFADVLILNKVETVDKETHAKLMHLLKLLNPVAKILESSYSKIDVREIINTKKFDFIRAASGPGWLQSLHEMTVQSTGNGDRLAPKPETLEYGINNFVYTARRPFHSRRLFALLHDKFIILQNNEIEEEEGDEDEEDEEEDEEEDDVMETESDAGSVEDFEQPDPEVILKNKRTNPAFGPVLRSKGFFWLATRPWQFGEWSQAGGMMTLGCGGPWFAELPDEDWPDDKDVRESILKDFQGPWGDRRQEIVFIGEGIDTAKISALLDECLLDDKDMKKWEKVMKNKKINRDEKTDKLAKMWEDGWEEWPALMADEEDEDEEEQVQGKHRISDYLGHQHGANSAKHGAHGHGHQKVAA